MNKKLITALLVVAMMLSLCSVAFAAGFSDTTDLGKDAQASINKLNALSIINGYPDGTFKPANNITRAEFAKIACIAGGMGSSADMLKSSTSKFSDVKTGEWYTGYVNLANSQGWVKGFPDGTFRPNAKISYAEVITVLTRLLGYNDNLPGPWPVDYIAKAGALDITEDVSFDANVPAARGDVAVMTDATLDCPIVEWDNDIEDFLEYGDERTLMEDAFDAAVNDDYYIVDSKNDKGTWQIQVRATDSDEEGLADYSDDNDGKQPSKWYDLADDVVISDGSLMTGLGGKIADLVYNDDDEVIEFIDVTSTSVSLDGEDLDVDTDDIKDGYPTKYDVDGKNYDVADWIVDKAKFVSSPNPDAYYKLSINSDGEIYKVETKNDKTPAVVDEYDADSAELTVKEAGNYEAYDEIEDIEFDSDDVLIESDAQGKFVEASELKENDLILVEKGSYGYDYYIEVLTGTDKEGTLDGYETGSPDQIEINGEWYDVAATCLLSTDGGEEFAEVQSDSDFDDCYDANVKFALNGANQVTVVISDADGTEGNTAYGVVTKIVDTDADGVVTKIKVMKKDGSEQSYSVDTDDVELQYTGTNELAVDDFIKFAVNADNEIDSLTILAYDNGTGAAFTNPHTTGTADVKADYSDSDSGLYIGTITDGDDDNNRITFKKDGGSAVNYKVNDNTVIFNAEPANGSSDDVAEIVSKDDLLDWAADTTFVGTKYAYVQYDGSTVEYIFINSNVAGSTDVNYASVLRAYNKSTDKWVKIDEKGTFNNYEVKSGSPEKGSIYNYTITGSKFSYKSETFDPEDTVTAATYQAVTKVDKTEKTVTLVNGTNVLLDDETVIYDYSDYYEDGSDPEYGSSISAISKGDDVWYVLDTDGNADLIVIVNNIKAAYVH